MNGGFAHFSDCYRGFNVDYLVLPGILSDAFKVNNTSNPVLQVKNWKRLNTLFKVIQAKIDIQILWLYFCIFQFCLSVKLTNSQQFHVFILFNPIEKHILSVYFKFMLSKGIYELEIFRKQPAI